MRSHRTRSGQGIVHPCARRLAKLYTKPYTTGFHYLCRRFFFSSRRRHTRFDCDWSSDVCSSDLMANPRGTGGGLVPLGELPKIDAAGGPPARGAGGGGRRGAPAGPRLYGGTELTGSEEGRGGEEWRFRGAPDHLKKKTSERARGG